MEISSIKQSKRLNDRHPIKNYQAYKEENMAHNKKKNQSIQTDPGTKKMIELVDKGIKITNYTSLVQLVGQHPVHGKVSVQFLAQACA